MHEMIPGSPALSDFDHAPARLTVDLGAVVDAQGRDVFTIDVNRERDDVEVLGIVAHLCMAINTCGGFKAIAAVVDEPEEAGAA